MADRAFKNNVLTLHNDIVILNGNFVVSDAGVVGTVKGAGIKSITKVTGDGKFEVVLEDKYSRMLCSSAGMVSAEGSGIAAIEIIDFDLQDKIQAGTAYTIQMYGFAGLAANPAHASVCSFILFLRRSSQMVGGE